MSTATQATAVAGDARHRMVAELFARVDQSDPEALDPWLADDAVLIFGNQPPLVGLDAIHAGNTMFFSAIGGLSHEVTGLWEADGSVHIRLRVTYTRLDGGIVTVPVVTHFEETDGKITHYQVYFDLTPVFADA